MALPVNRYGQGPEQLFYPASPLAGRTPPAPIQPAAPAEPVQPKAVVADIFQTPNADPTAPAIDNPHPNPSLGAAMQSAATGLGLMSPTGLAMGMIGLALSDARNQAPSLSGRSQIAGLIGDFFGGRSPQTISDTPTAIGDKSPASIDVQSVFSGGADMNDGGNQTGQTSGTPGSGTGAGDAGPGDNQSADNRAKGGLIRSYAGGGVVELFGGGKVAMGPGGGMDDMIPTTIDGGRLANLSDGEFVIPADVVSAMGDGSTNAGATRLYDLVKAIRQAKTGSERQAQPVQFDRILKQVTQR